MDRRHEWLTATIQRSFYYAPALRVAFVKLRRPPVGFQYRISWRLAEAEVASDEQVTGAMRFNRTRFEESLLGARKVICLEVKPEPGQAEVVETIKLALASFAEWLSEAVAKQTGISGGIDVEQLDLSLMVCDRSRADRPPVLRVVAGTYMHDAAYREFTMEIGDGNAGKAFKKRMARIFDSRLARDDPKHHTYLNIPGSPVHAVLYSLPLLDPKSGEVVYGILNIGTFSEDQGELLRELQSQTIEEMTNTAQSS